MFCYKLLSDTEIVIAHYLLVVDGSLFSAGCILYIAKLCLQIVCSVRLGKCLLTLIVKQETLENYLQFTVNGVYHCCTCLILLDEIGSWSDYISLQLTGLFNSMILVPQCFG